MTPFDYLIVAFCLGLNLILIYGLFIEQRNMPKVRGKSPESYTNHTREEALPEENSIIMVLNPVHGQNHSFSTDFPVVDTHKTASKGGERT